MTLCRVKTVARLAFMSAFLAWFGWFFLWHAQGNWDGIFHRYHVPSIGYPGGDSRNIQQASHCLKAGLDPFEAADCIRSGTLLKQVYPTGSVPRYNYPIWWARAYALFGNDSERCFLLLWRANALMLMAVVSWLAWRWGLWLLPVLLLNPVTLLTLERGNVDALTFATAACGWMVMAPSVTAQVFGVLSASVLKLYPAVGLIPLLLQWRQLDRRLSVWMMLILLPALAITLRDLPHYLGATPQGYPFSYGLWAIGYAPQLQHESRIGIASVVATMIGAFAIGPQIFHRWRKGWLDGIASWGEHERSMFFVFLLIYLGTFFAFTNWAYRLVFLYPVFAISVMTNQWPIRVFGLLIGAMLWAPWARMGWELQTWLAYPVAGLGLGVVGLALRHGVWVRKESA